MSETLSEILSKIYDELINDFKNRDYILADTRIPNVSLYDHLILTAGIAVATVKELLGREERKKTPEEICGKNISEEDLVSVIRIASILHDWGKDYERSGLEPKRAYIKHTERSVEWSKQWLEKNGVKQPYTDLIVSAIERHQLDAKPKTLHEKIVCLADSLASAGDRPELAKAATHEELTKVMSSTFQLHDIVFEGDNGLILILGDVDRVKSYVFETSKLPEIRGASELLNELNFKELETIFENELSLECLIYNGGGSFLAIVPKSMAIDIMKKVGNLYLTKSMLATITCVKSDPLGPFEFSRGIMPYADEDVKKLDGEGIGKWLLESHFGKNKNKWSEKKGFGEIVSLLSAKLRIEKMSRDSIPFFEALPIGMRCSSCGKRMVVMITQDEDKLCNVCSMKRSERAELRRSFRERFGEWLRNEKNLQIEDIHDRFPQDLDKLAEPYEGYMAFIYADGNDIGSLLSNAKSPADYRHISEALKEGTEKSLFEALLYTLGEDALKKLNPIPFEIINIGGDDISLILAAPYVFDFSEKFLELFESNLKKLNVTISLGMVICKAKYPVYFAEKLADRLLDDAKRKAKESKKSGREESAFSYLYLTSQLGIEDHKEILKSTYSFEMGGRKWITIMRPYTLSELKKLLFWANQLEDLFSTSQLNALAEALSKGRASSINFLLYQIARLSVEKRNIAQALLKDIDETLNCKNGWGSVEEGDATPLIDLKEIFDIRRKK